MYNQRRAYSTTQKRSYVTIHKQKVNNILQKIKQMYTFMFTAW